ncbi:MAG TPA: hypothetical protein VK014_13910 [Cyclobacteriaceae bacterium]|nr:hypothetical protein [Cyclobacteriaceae bacterium]
MTKYFTQSDLIRYVYQEMSEFEMEKLVQALHEDDDLMQEYIDLLSTVEQLDQLILEPSDNVIKAIKETAKSSGLERV